MTSIDLGVLVGRAMLDTSLFDRAYAATIGKMRSFGAQAEQAAAGASALDESLAATAASADRAAAGLVRAQRATTAQTSADTRAAAAAARHAEATTAVADTLAAVATATPRVQQATLRLAAAQERLNAIQASGTATTRQLATAQASLIGAQRSLTAAEEAGAASGSRFRSGMASTLKMAGQLGLIVGVLASVKAAIDITKEANDFQRAMVQVQTNADVTATEVNRASGALLKMAGPVAAAPAELATAWYHAKSVGLDYAKSIETTRIAAEGARVGHADLEETMNALTSTVASNIPGVENMSKAMGQLIAIVGTGDMKLSDLNSALSSGILTIVKGYGLSLTDVGAALATFGDNNIRGAEAATMLRMAVQAMAVPAKLGKDQLTKLGLASDTLAKDMQKGGLNKAILDLKAHLDAAHVSSVQVGAVLTNVFGKRAGPGIAVLISQVDRLESKFEILRDAGSSFDDKWKATTQTASFALASLGHTAEAAGIALTEKLGPSIASAANWLGTAIPHALSVLQDALGPTIHMVGSDFVTAWHLGTAVLGPVASALGTVARLLGENQTLTHTILPTVLTMWAAFKGYTIAVTALTAVRLAVMRFASTAPLALASVGASVSRLMAGLGPVGLAVAAIGIALAGATTRSNAHADAMKREKALADDLTDSLDQQTGALTALSRSKVYDALESAGAIDAAKQLHISLSTVTDAAIGNKKAITDVQAAISGLKLPGGKFDLLPRLSDDQIKQLQNSPKLIDRQAAAAALLTQTIGGTNKALKTATQSVRDKAAADKTGAAASTQALAALVAQGQTLKITNPVLKTYAVMMGLAVDSTGKIAGAATDARSALDTIQHAALTATETMSTFMGAWTTFANSAGTAEDRATLIGATLKAANGDALNYAAVMVETAQANQQFADGVKSAAKSAKESTGAYLDSIINLKTGTIDYTKAAAAPLISNLQAMQKAAMDAAQAQYQHSRATMSGKASADAAYRTYKAQTQGALIDEAKNLGLTKDQAKKLAEQYFGMPKHVKTLIEQEGANPVVDVLNKIGRQLAYLTGHPWTPKVDANVATAITNIRRVGDALEGLHGKTIEVKTVYTKNGAVTMKAAGGYVAGPGTGTSDSIPARLSNGEFVVNAAQTSKHLGLLRAINSGVRGFASGGHVSKAHQAHLATSNTSASDALTAISLDKTGFSWTKFSAQLAAATAAIAAAVRAGATQAQITSLTDRLDRDSAKGRKIERGLGAGIRSGTAKLGSMANNLTDVASPGDIRGQLNTIHGLLQQAGLPKDFINGLHDQDKKILGIVRSRNSAAAHLTKANEALKAAQDVLNTDRGNFAGAISGSFDITTAGQDDNGHVTKGSLAAAERQDLTRVRAAVTGLKKLASWKVFPGAYLRQLMGNPVASLPTIQALLSMNPSELKSFAADQSSIASLANSGAATVAGRLDQGAVDRAQKTADTWKTREATRQKHLDTALKREADRIVNEIKDLHLTSDIKAGDLALVVETGKNRNKKATRSGTHGHGTRVTH